jgi:hypothetical protein
MRRVDRPVAASCTACRLQLAHVAGEFCCQPAQARILCLQSSEVIGPVRFPRFAVSHPGNPDESHRIEVTRR